MRKNYITLLSSILLLFSLLSLFSCGRSAPPNEALSIGGNHNCRHTVVLKNDFEVDNSYHTIHGDLAYYVGTESMNKFINKAESLKNDNDCSACTIILFIRDLNIPREIFQGILDVTSIYYYDYNLDILYSGNDELIEQYYTSGNNRISDILLKQYIFYLKMDLYQYVLQNQPVEIEKWKNNKNASDSWKYSESTNKHTLLYNNGVNTLYSDTFTATSVRQWSIIEFINFFNISKDAVAKIAAENTNAVSPACELNVDKIFEPDSYNKLTSSFPNNLKYAAVDPAILDNAVVSFNNNAFEQWNKPLSNSISAPSTQQYTGEVATTSPNKKEAVGGNHNCRHTVVLKNDFPVDESYHSIHIDLAYYVGTESMNKFINKTESLKNDNDCSACTIILFIRDCNVPREIFQGLLDVTSMYYYDYNLDILYSGNDELIEQYYTSGNNRISDILLKQFIHIFKMDLYHYVLQNQPAEIEKWINNKNASDSWKYSESTNKHTLLYNNGVNTLYSDTFASTSVREWSIIEFINFFNLSKDTVAKIAVETKNSVSPACELNVDKIFEPDSYNKLTSSFSNNLKYAAVDPAILDNAVVSFNNDAFEQSNKPLSNSISKPSTQQYTGEVATTSPNKK